MLCYIISYGVILCYIILYDIILCYIMLYHNIQNYCSVVTFLEVYSKSPHIRTYLFESQAEIGSYFRGTKTNFKV